MPLSPIRELQFDRLATSVYETNEDLGAAAARVAAQIIRDAIAERGKANVIVATGNSQRTFLHSLREAQDLNWRAVTLFDMDEYVNLPPGHRACLSHFLQRHFLDQVPVGFYFPVPGLPGDLDAACQGFEALLRAHPADLCCVGIGENGHLAFNDPPVADFNDSRWVKPVLLDEASRRQQVGEGHFDSLDQVPTHALTLTIPALLSATRVLAMVPEARKAEAVRESLLGPISTACPASILRHAPHAHLYLDRDSAASILGN